MPPKAIIMGKAIGNNHTAGAHGNHGQHMVKARNRVRKSAQKTPGLTGFHMGPGWCGKKQKSCNDD